MRVVMEERITSEDIDRICTGYYYAMRRQVGRGSV
jgi:hypothetical protein